MTDEKIKDFFISYNHADQQWAEWIAWQLEQAGRKVVIQAWDFRPGANFVLEMDKATRNTNRTIVVLSPNFFTSDFTPSEWATTFAKDPTGEKHLVVPVLVEPMDVGGLLGQLIYIDLTNKDPDDAAKVLVAGIEPGRSKPTTAPNFPGVGRQAKSRAGDQRQAGLDWQLANPVPTVTWVNSPFKHYGSSRPTVEVALVPLESQVLPVARLSRMPNVLAELGRRGGLFSATQEIETDAGADVAMASSAPSRDNGSVGLAVGRSGQRSAWLALPSDMLGSVFDPEAIAPRIASVVEMLMTLDIPVADRYAISAALGPMMTVTVGSASTVGNRNQASLSLDDGPIILPIEDSVSGRLIALNSKELAAEIVARILARLKN